MAPQRGSQSARQESNPRCRIVGATVFQIVSKRPRPHRQGKGLLSSPQSASDASGEDREDALLAVIGDQQVGGSCAGGSSGRGAVRGVASWFKSDSSATCSVIVATPQRDQMSAPNPKRQKSAIQTLDSLFDNATNVWVIHYSCESFYDRPNGFSPRITSIAIRKLHSGQTVSFSIHQVAERLHVKPADIVDQYDVLERRMLDEYFAYISGYRTVFYIHWNMRDINYGFAAIEHRYRVLGGEPYVVDDGLKVDLARLFIDIYGVSYTGHPRLETILSQNRIEALDMLSGADEAAAFDEGRYVDLHRSTLRKVDVIANLAGRAHDRKLRTATSWWKMRGGSVTAFLKWLMTNYLVIFLLTIGGFLLSAVGIGIAFLPG